MEPCLQLKKSNCKNCYKCIRYCPVKSIRFSENQAHIISDECILCGRCYVNCPQNAKQIRNDVGRAKEMIASGTPVYVSLAPSFAGNYRVSIDAMEKALQKLGFAAVEETAIGATIVKKRYEEMVKNREQKVIISSCCHTVNSLVQKKYPIALQYLAKVLSPMQAHCAKMKTEHPECLTVFIGPCLAKKDETDHSKNLVDLALTFEELTAWLKEEEITLDQSMPDTRKPARARLFPSCGGILDSMDLEEDYTYIAVDGIENCMSALEDIESGNLNNCFIEMSACAGSCLGGPAMDKENMHHLQELAALKKTAKKVDHDLLMPDKSVLHKSMPFEGKSRQMPGSAAIEEILRKMGKHNKDQELNCGSCGYNTCREKAVAVLAGKADLTMCLPYLKEKAESFSDKIINNTPNGIIVLNEQLELQQMNTAAQEILNIKNQAEYQGEPVVRLLNPADYLLCMTEGKNIYEKKKYLDEYQKYVEETVIYDKEYHIIMSIMKDVTEEEKMRENKESHNRQVIEITDKVVEKQMRVVQEIASLLGETTAETKIALTKLKETLADEE